MIYFDSNNLIIILELCGFLKLTMQDFINDKNDFLNKYLFFVLGVSSPCFSKITFQPGFYWGFLAVVDRFELKFLHTDCRVSYDMVSDGLICKTLI